MTKLRTYIEEKLQGGDKILSIYLTAGYPDPGATLPLLQAITDAGADLIELGVPFSDPLADGPTIQGASQAALAAGTTLELTLRMLREFRRYSDLPVLLMGYANPFFRFGLDRLMSLSHSAGASGFIIPDLPPEESEEIYRRVNALGMDYVYLVAPNTPRERIRQINARTTGFIYAVSVTGVTGARQKLPPETTRFLKRLRTLSDHPILIGFGISNPETARRMSRLADGIIIGSAVINLISEHTAPENAREAVSQFVNNIKRAIRKV